MPHKVKDTVYRGWDAISRERVKCTSHATVDAGSATSAFAIHNCPNGLNVINDFVVLGYTHRFYLHPASHIYESTDPLAQVTLLLPQMVTQPLRDNTH